MKVYEILREEQAGPVKPLKVPQVPKLPAEDGDLGSGVTVHTTKQGTRVHMSSDGSFTFDKSGTPIFWMSPSFTGMHQVHDLKTGNFIQKYENGPLAIEQEYDKTGKPIGRAGTSYKFGVATIAQDRKGNKTYIQRQGDEETVIKTSSLKDRWGNPVTSGSGEVVGTTPDTRKYRYTDKRTKTEIK